MAELNTEFADGRDSPGLMLWRVSMQWQALQRAALRPHELTHVQFVLLAGLLDLGHPVSQAELARHMGIDAMMTSQVIRALESRNLVVRGRDAQDSRVVKVEATSAGSELANAAISDVEAVDREFFGRLGDSQSAFATQLGVLVAGGSIES
ncbi:MarR family transcriptional regulator [Microbacterium mitrae]|uniref:MarR family transcriptional regulator n=1 Tax=Microbacterium mitrae TaxID=664640 RepID=A0A5C8HR29_9MICO|nr:MarR family transcriptional regulator [Microbacterium mitrae]TXK05441.1 MarR family transcriptional regulator [Microbacterium mitrae]